MEFVGDEQGIQDASLEAHIVMGYGTRALFHQGKKQEDAAFIWEWSSGVEAGYNHGIQFGEPWKYYAKPRKTHTKITFHVSIYRKYPDWSRKQIGVDQRTERMRRDC